MRTVTVALVGVLALVCARVAREAAATERAETIEEPFAPSPATAPMLAVGYRELAADLLFIRLRVYYGGYYDTTADQVAALGEAIVTLDPKFDRAYSYAANAMTIAPRGVNQAIYLRAIALLERGMREFPADWEMPMLAGQMYIQDLKSENPDEQRAWFEKGTLLVESAIRKPGASLKAAMWAASLRTKLGQQDRAEEGLRELLLVTNDKRARAGLLAALASLKKANADEIAAEIDEQRKRFEREWKAGRPAVRPSMYILIGPPLPRSFDMTDLATGGRDIVGAEGFEHLEPLYDDPKETPK
jgi:hypothetical protein